MVGLFLAFGPPALLAKSESPAFCASCHVMEDQHKAWAHSIHKNIKCVDCHLPNTGPIRHYVWKGIDGMKDFAYFHTKTYKEPIALSAHGKKVVQENCTQCHAGVIDHMMDKKRQCWDCHRKQTHKGTALSKD